MLFHRTFLIVAAIFIAAISPSSADELASIILAAPPPSLPLLSTDRIALGARGSGLFSIDPTSFLPNFGVNLGGGLTTGGALSIANLAITNQLLFVSSPGHVDSLATVSYGMLCTDGLGVPSICTTLPFTLGLSGNSPRLNKWRAALARVQAGTGRARLLTIADSTGMGAGTGTGSGYTIGAWPNAWPRRLATYLEKSGIAVSDNSIFADAGAPVAYGSYDTRAVLGSGWVSSFNGTTAASLGGYLFKYNTGSASAFSFTPTGPLDTIKVYYLQQDGNGTFAVNVDGGGSLGTVNAGQAGGPLLSVATFTVAKDVHTINLVAGNDAVFYILGIVTYDSTTPAVDIIRAGWFGARIASFVDGGTTFAFSALNVLKNNVVPDFTVIELTINDSNNGTPLATYTANMQTLITSAQLSGDVLLMAGPPSNTPQATDGTLDTFIAALSILASTNNSPLLSMKSRWTSYAVINPILPYNDNLHPTALGYWDMGLAVSEAVARP